MGGGEGRPVGLRFERSRSEAGKGGEVLAPSEPGRVTHDGHQGGTADLAKTGQRAGKTAHLGVAIGVLASWRMSLQLDADGPQETDLGGHLGSHVGERNGWVTPIQLDRRLRSTDPFSCPLGALMAPGLLGDEGTKPLDTDFYQHTRISPALQHCQLGGTEIASERGHWHQLANQALDPDLVDAGFTSQTIRGPHPSVQAGGLSSLQAKRLQPGRVHQAQPGEGVGVDPVGLGVSREELCAGPTTLPSSPCIPGGPG